MKTVIRRRLLQPEAPGFGEIREAICRYFVMKLPSKDVKNHEKILCHYSVRQKIAAPGPTKLRTIFPHTPVLPNPPQLPYGAKYFVWPYFLFFPYWIPIGPMDPWVPYGGLSHGIQGPLDPWVPRQTLPWDPWSFGCLGSLGGPWVPGSNRGPIGVQ
jgi:hypothetical protein